MSDHCKSCIPEFGDFDHLAKLPPCLPGEGYLVLCEGCGPAYLNNDGTCQGGCLIKAHGPQPPEVK